MCEQSWESELPVENRIISATPGGGAGLSHTFCGTCTHSVGAARFSIFYYCESIISGLCFLAAEGILAIVTVSQIASICLSGTLFLFCFFFFFSFFSRDRGEVEWIRGQWSCCLCLELCSCPNYGQAFFNFLSTPIWLLFALHLRPIQVYVCRCVPSPSTLKPFEAKVHLSSCFRSDCREQKLQETLSTIPESFQPGSDPGLSCGLRGADKSGLMGYIYCSSVDFAGGARLWEPADEFKDPCGSRPPWLH